MLKGLHEIIHVKYFTSFLALSRDSMNGSYFNIIHKHFNNKFSVLEFLYEYICILAMMGKDFYYN